MVGAHTFNSSTQEAEADFVSSRPAWVPGQSELHRETLSRKREEGEKERGLNFKNKRRRGKGERKNLEPVRWLSR